MKLLKPVKGNQTPQIRFYVDTESLAVKNIDGESENHSFKLGSCWVVKNKGAGKVIKKVYELWKPADLFSVIDKYVKAKHLGWVIAHNYNFDALILDLFNQLKAHSWEVKRWIIDSDMFIVIAQQDNRKIAFVDSFNYFKTSIKAMGKQIGLEKMEADFQNDPDFKLMDYCKRDGEILMEFMESFIAWWHNSDYGNFRYTLAGLSLESYRHRFMNYDIWLHDNPEAINLEISSYRGGRVEASFIGKPKEDLFYKLDINSQYPYVMHENNYPVALVDVIKNPSKDKLLDLLQKYLVIAKVDYLALDNSLGVRRDRLIFPTGKVTGTFCTPELRYLTQRLKLVKIHELAYYRSAPIFKSFVEHFYAKRLEHRANNMPIYDLFTKLLMNSLYGKFGQQNTKYKCLGDSELDYNCTRFVISDVAKTRIQEIHLDGKVYVAEGTELAYNAFVAVASHVTAYARMLLWRYMVQAGKGNLFYVDTDSLIVNEKGRDNLADLINNNELGKLKEEAMSSYLEIRNAKDYTFGADVKRKGIRKEAEQLNSMSFRQIKFSKIRSMLAQGIDNQVTVSHITKQLSDEYKKGKVTASGQVVPLALSEF